MHDKPDIHIQDAPLYSTVSVKVKVISVGNEVVLANGLKKQEVTDTTAAAHLVLWEDDIQESFSRIIFELSQNKTQPFQILPMLHVTIYLKIPSLYKMLKLLAYKVYNHIMPASLAVRKHFHQRKKILLIATNVIQYKDAKPNVWSFSMGKIITHYQHSMMYSLQSHNREAKLLLSKNSYYNI